MDALEALLRDTLERPAAGTYRPVDDLIAGARRDRRRGLALRAAGGALAVALAVAAAAVVATTRTAPPPPARPFPLPTVVHPDRMANTTQQVYRTGYPQAVSMADATDGYAVFTTCPDIQRACTDTIRATHDGGRTYTPVTTPPDPHASQVYAFGPDSAILLTAAIPADATHVAGWVTIDGGRTWQPADHPIATADRIPPGARLIYADQGGASLVYAATADATLTRPTTAPAGAEPVTPTPDHGAYLLAAADAWYVSTDQGHTWHVATTALDLSEYDWLVGTASDGRLFALADGPAVGEQHMLASEDGGRTWQTVALPPATPMVLPTGRPGKDWTQLSAAVTPGGDVLLNDGARTWRMARGGSTFTPDDQAFPIISVAGAGPLVVAVSADLRLDHPVPTVYLSTDGLTWQPARW